MRHSHAHRRTQGKVATRARAPILTLGAHLTQGSTYRFKQYMAHEISMNVFHVLSAPPPSPLNSAQGRNYTIIPFCMAYGPFSTGVLQPGAPFWSMIQTYM